MASFPTPPTKADEELVRTSGKPPCHKFACAIQNCMQRNSFQQSICEPLVDELYKCCVSFYKMKGEDERTPSCPKPDRLKKKLEIRGTLRDEGTLYETREQTRPTVKRVT